MASSKGCKQAKKASHLFRWVPASFCRTTHLTHKPGKMGPTLSVVEPTSMIKAPLPPWVKTFGWGRSGEEAGLGWGEAGEGRRGGEDGGRLGICCCSAVPPPLRATWTVITPAVASLSIWHCQTPAGNFDCQTPAAEENVLCAAFLPHIQHWCSVNLDFDFTVLVKAQHKWHIWIKLLTKVNLLKSSFHKVECVLLGNLISYTGVYICPIYFRECLSGTGIGALWVEEKCQRLDQIDDASPAGQGLLTIPSLPAKLIYVEHGWLQWETLHGGNIGRIWCMNWDNEDQHKSKHEISHPSATSC